ncbi:myelin-oligodendrocyte glycoprotein-like [Cynoglossus semilaevis]|uniref:Myelin-oligodendrocyte glycoprotein-like n=1 Tax=Cynoglossus semilaevis TaxID=244447 RepID=A0A3P8V403_CYNSE|nr:myelin-oligodendrocyte glycoprotein-like [Cynoglossus semilaevis]
MTHSRNVLVVYVMTFSVSFWLAVFAVAADSASILPASDGDQFLTGSAQPITASLGDDVVLPCLLSSGRDARLLTFEWSRLDVEPDPSDPLRRVYYVYLRRGGAELTDMKLASYNDRASAFEAELTRGNLSLSIRNVTYTDRGMYRCFVPSLRSHVIIQLVVVPASPTTWTTAPSLVPRNFHTPDSGDINNNNDDHKNPITWILSATFVVLLSVSVAIFIVVQQWRKKEATKGEPNHLDVDQSRALTE